jgi:cellulose synthase/poly-beta-1,6-N-acetylglucosamine synthase-like glycosyltransferase
LQSVLVPTTVFAASVAFVLYILLGYPLLLGWQARRRGKPVDKRPVLKSVSVLLPVHNGEAWLRQKLESILALDYPRELLQVLVISDGSDDGTEEIARQFALLGVELVSVPRGGKALALNEGMRRARGEILFFTDVRQALDPASLRSLVACFADSTVGVASGELVIRRGGTSEEANVGLYWEYEKWIRKQQSRVDSMLGATGCIYAMRAGLAGPLPEGTILDDVYLPLRAFFRGYRIVFEAGARAYDYPTSLDSEFRRKVRTQAGVYQVIGAYPALLGWKNRMWSHFVSQKLGRLLLPWFMPAILVSSFGLPGTWRTLALGAHLVFYGLLLVDPLLPERFPLKRLSSPARTVFVLLLAAFCAAFVLWLPVRNVWGQTKVNTGQGEKGG